MQLTKVVNHGTLGSHCQHHASLDLSATVKFPHRTVRLPHLLTVDAGSAVDSSTGSASSAELPLGDVSSAPSFSCGFMNPANILLKSC
jgi:hypothetical protein